MTCQHIFFFESGDTPSTTKKNRNNKDSTEKAQESITSKNITIEFCVLSEATTNIAHNIRELRFEKRKLVKEFRADACDGDKKKARIRLEKYYDTQNKGDEESVSEEDLYDAPDSQESILEEIYNLDQEIVAQEHSLKVARKSLTQKEKAM